MGSAVSVLSDFSDVSDDGCVDAEYIRKRVGEAFQQRAFDRVANEAGRVAADQVKKLLVQTMQDMHEKQQWWVHLDATQLTVGEDAGDIVPDPQTPMEKMQFMFKWADQDEDGYLNLQETNRLMALSGQECGPEMWMLMGEKLGFDRRVGMDFDCCRQAWDDIEDDFQAVKAQEKLEFMFKWTDKDADGFLSREEVETFMQLQDPDASVEAAEFAGMCERHGCRADKGLTLEVVKKEWADEADEMHRLIEREEKMGQMFRWADKDWDGLLSRLEAEALQKLSTPDINFTPELWNGLAEEHNFDPVKGFDYAKARALWEDVDDDYRALFGQAEREAEAAQAYIATLVPNWRLLMMSESGEVALDTLEECAAVAPHVSATCDEETSSLAFNWLKRAITTRHGSPMFPKVKECVRALLASDLFWKGLGCKGNSWVRGPNVYNDQEWNEFIGLCNEKLAEIGDRYKDYFDEQRLGEKIGHLGEEVAKVEVRQPMPACPNLPLKGPGEPFTNDGSGEDQYMVHLKLLAHAMNHRFQEKMKHVAHRVSAAGGGGADADAEPSCQHRPAPVKTMLRMAAKLRGDHLNNAAPRSAANLDTIRCGISCKTPEDLERMYAAVKEEFNDRVVRVKNGYAKDYDPKVSFHYRGLLMNIEWHTGVKYGDLHKDPAVLVAWDLFAAHACNTAKMSVTRFAALADQGGWHTIDWFSDAAIADKEVVLIVEAQLILEHYMNMRQHTHLYYKVVREPTWAELALDCLPDNVEAVGGKLGDFEEEDE